MKINYAWIIIIILVIFMINKNMKNGTLDFDISSFKNTLVKLNDLSPIKFKGLSEEEEPISIISNSYDQAINTKPINQKKDFISPNPEGSTEFRFVDESPKTAWSNVDVSQHPQYYTSNFEDEKVDTSGFLMKNNSSMIIRPHTHKLTFRIDVL